jgi:hypothetical protein
VNVTVLEELAEMLAKVSKILPDLVTSTTPRLT